MYNDSKRLFIQNLYKLYELGVISMNKLSKSIIKGFKTLANTIQTVVNFILFTSSYIVGLGLTFLIVKVFRIKLNSEPNNNSNWQDINIKKKPIEEYMRQI